MCGTCGARGFSKNCCREKCPLCGDKISHAGPLWIGNILDADFIEKMLSEAGSCEERKFFECALSESQKNTLPYDLHGLAKLAKISAPRTERVLDGLRRKGFFASKSTYSGHHIRTDAEVSEIVACMKGR